MRAVLPALLCCLIGQLGAETLTVEERELWIDDPADSARPTAAILWLHDRGRGPLEDRERWQDAGLLERGVALAFYQAPADGWEAESDRVSVLAAARVLRERYAFEPEQILLVGEGAGAAHAQRLVLARPYWFAGAVLVRGADGQSVLPAGEHRPLFGIYAAATDHRVPVKTLRLIERRLRRAGYPVHWRSELRAEGYGEGLFELTAEVLAASDLLGQPPAAVERVEADDQPPAAD